MPRCRRSSDEPQIQLEAKKKQLDAKKKQLEAKKPYSTQPKYELRKFSQSLHKERQEFYGEMCGFVTNEKYTGGLATVMKNFTFEKELLFDRPDIFLVAGTVKQNKPKLVKLLTDSFGHTNVAMKFTRIAQSKDENACTETTTSTDLQEANLEASIGYFLTDLRIGYPRILSRNFAAVLGWFNVPVPGKINDTATYFAEIKNELSGSKKTPPAEDPTAIRVLLQERAEYILLPWIQKHPTVYAIRSILWQVLHALETAWCTHNFLHLDLHVGNVMLQESTSDSDGANKPWAFTRATYETGKWVIPTEDHHNGLVKLIDFGRSRMIVPESENEWLSDKTESRTHSHTKLLEGPSLEVQDTKTRTIDMRQLTISLIRHLPIETWEDLEWSNGYREFTKFCNDALGGDSALKRVVSDIAYEDIKRLSTSPGDDDTFFQLLGMARSEDQNLSSSRLEEIHRRLLTKNEELEKASKIPSVLLEHEFFAAYYKSEGDEAEEGEFLVANPKQEDCMEEIAI